MNLIDEFWMRYVVGIDEQDYVGCDLFDVQVVSVGRVYVGFVVNYFGFEGVGYCFGVICGFVIDYDDMVVVVVL